MNKRSRGGKREGSGRKTLSPASPTVVFPVRMTAEQRDKLHRLGGAEWIRSKIDKAKE